MTADHAPDPADAAAGCRCVRLVGTAGVAGAAGAWVALGPVDAVLIAWLAVEGPTTRARLSALLWPDEDEAVLRNRLRQRLFALKQRLGTDAVQGKQTLSLAPALHWPGWDAEPPEGEFLGDDDHAHLPELSDWLGRQRQQLRMRRREAAAAQASELESRGKLVEAIAVAERLMALEPLQEHTHRLVMRLHYLRGNRAAAVAAFERCERLLRDELGVRPGDETLALLAQVDSGRQLPVPASLQVPATVLRPPRLIGRDAEWAQARAAWQQGQAVVVIGEGGLGKSRLLGDLACARSPAALVVSARPGDQRVPLTLLSRVLRALAPVAAQRLPEGTRLELARVLPELGTAAPGDVEPANIRFLNAMKAALMQAVHEGLHGLVLDDLHFADGDSMAALQPLLADTQLRWAAAWRPGDMPQALREFVDALARDRHAVTLRLRPLDLPSIQALVDSLVLPGFHGAAWAPRLLRHTGGNPQFILETLKSWLVQGGGPQLAAEAGLPLPASLPKLIDARITALSRDAVRLARCAAVAGPDFSAELAGVVLGVRTVDLADAWAELEAAQVFHGGHFAHDLVQEAALASVPKQVAQAVSADVAQALAAAGAPAQRVAVHWQAAGRAREALPLLKTAAADAARRARPVEAARWLEQAAQLHEQLGEADQAFDLLDQAVDQHLLHRGRGSVAALIDRMAALACTAEQQAIADLQRGWLHSESGQTALAVECGRRALGRLEGATASLTAARVHNLLGPALRNLGDLLVAEQHLRAALELMQRFGHAGR